MRTNLMPFAEDMAVLLNIDLQSFDNTQVTTQASLNDEMRTFYNDTLIDNAEAELVHDQWAQKHPIPKGGGKTINFRKYAPLPKALVPLQEGVTPSGRSMTVSSIEATIKQYGDYIELSDVLMLTAVDNNLAQASKLLGVQSGETLDTISREVMNSGTNVQFAKGQVSARHLLTDSNLYDVDTARLAARNLKTGKAKRIKGNFIAICHIDSTYDITGDPKWEEWKKYARPEDLYEGEIGRLHGTRYVETTEAKIFAAEDLSENARNLTFASVGAKVITVQEALTADDQVKLIGRNMLLKGIKYTVASATANTITVLEDVANSPVNGDLIYPGEAGAEGRAVYSTLHLGADAYGTTEVTGGGLEFIVKQLGSAGTADPLNQRATSGWKATKVTEILVDDYLLRVEHCTSFDGLAN